VASLRAIPGLRVIRPADAAETVEAWRAALAGPGPTCLILTRQNLPVLDRAGAAAGAAWRAAPTSSPTRHRQSPTSS